jgi:hypothetical protein
LFVRQPAASPYLHNYSRNAERIFLKIEIAEFYKKEKIADLLQCFETSQNVASVDNSRITGVSKVHCYKPTIQHIFT